MFFDSDNSKEAIKTRMFRVALTFWHVKNMDELDPLVKILMEALSAELYDVTNDIKNAESRILEKMAHLLAPDLLTAPVPAHAIMQARPAEASEVITADSQFYTQSKMVSKQDGPKDTSVDLCFSAVNSVKIFDAKIGYLFSGSSLYFFDQEGNRNIAGQATKGIPVPESCVWFGLKIHPHNRNIDRMRFFFDFNNVDISSAEQFYQYLPLCRWSINEVQLSVSPGLQEGERASLHREQDILNSDLMHSLRHNVISYYDKKFITIDDNIVEIKPESLKPYPDQFKKVLSQSTLQKLNEGLLWVKVVFPTSIRQELLDELNVKVNAFPVMNAKKNDLRYRLRGGRNIIPLPNIPNERFVAIKSFTDGVKEYKAIPYRKSGDEALGTYNLRIGGMERFDSRNGKEMIEYLLQLLRSESAAFSAIGRDYIISTLKEMNQLIAMMEQKTNTALSDALEIPHYIIVKPEENQEIMFVEYWTTNINLANNIRSGTKLQQSSGVTCKSDSLVLLTATMGGKDKLKSEEELHAFKYSLLTRGRIVTVEDIRSFCFYELGSRLGNVTVKRGFLISENPKVGAKRTVDVILTPANHKTEDQDEWNLICNQLRSKLQTKSGMSYNYRIMSGGVS